MVIKKLYIKDYFNPTTRNQFEKDLYEGLKECGFIILKQHSVSTHLLDDAYLMSKKFFNQSNELKNKYISTIMPYQRGYVPYKVEKAKDAKAIDLKEFYQIGINHNLFPNEDFKRIFLQLYNELEDCSKILLRALTPSLKLNNDYFDNILKKGNHILRLLHYPPINENEPSDAVRAAAHEDINLITLLVAAKGKGLQLLDNDGNWVDIETEQGDIVVDTGDMMSRITNNHLPATTHRVINGDQIDQSRYSMPFFCHPDPSALLKVIEHFKDGNEQADILSNDFLDERLKEIGLKK